VKNYKYMGVRKHIKRTEAAERRNGVNSVEHCETLFEEPRDRNQLTNHPSLLQKHGSNNSKTSHSDSFGKNNMQYLLGMVFIYQNL